MQTTPNAKIADREHALLVTLEAADLTPEAVATLHLATRAAIADAADPILAGLLAVLDEIERPSTNY